MKKISVYMFIDALGWEIVNKYGFLENELLHRRKIEMQFGYSSTAMPTILSGETPDKHGHFSFFYYDPKNSPFKKFKYMKFLFGAGLHPKCLFNRGRIRRVISKLVAKYLGYTGYFSLYGVPFEQLPYFDYCEKNDIFAKNGLSPVKNLCDVLEESGLNFHISDWRKSDVRRHDPARLREPRRPPRSHPCMDEGAPLFRRRKRQRTNLSAICRQNGTICALLVACALVFRYIAP